MKRIFGLLLILGACTPAEPLDPNARGSIYVQITGNDGAAFRQIGQATLMPTGEVSCTMIYPPVLFGDDTTDVI